MKTPQDFQSIPSDSGCSGCIFNTPEYDCKKEENRDLMEAVMLDGCDGYIGIFKVKNEEDE